MWSNQQLTQATEEAARARPRSSAEMRSRAHEVMREVQSMYGGAGSRMDEPIDARYLPEPEHVQVIRTPWLDKRGQTTSNAKARVRPATTFRVGEPLNRPGLTVKVPVNERAVEASRINARMRKYNAQQARENERNRCPHDSRLL
jgi:hypothetical protein